MKCNNCGMVVEPGRSYCPNCGAMVDVPYAERYSGSAMTPGQAVGGSSVLVWGILGLVFSCVPVLGLVFSAIALGKRRRIWEVTGYAGGKIKAGKILAVFGLVFGIISTVYFSLILFLGILGVM